MIIISWILLAVAVIWLLVQYQDVIQTLLIVAGAAMLAYTLYEAFKLPKEPRERHEALPMAERLLD